MVCTKRPTIGILAQEISRKSIPDDIKGESFIAASYVKHMEAAGADVIPILLNSTDTQLEKLFQSVNGIMIPGGGASLSDSKYIKNTRFLYELAKDANDKGEHFPIWGTCLGFEALMVIGANSTALDDVDAINIPLPLEFTEHANECRMFQDASRKIMQIYANSPVTYNYHKKCITKDSFLNSQELTSLYKVISYNTGRQGKKFVSAVEGHNYPFYGVQWHPEKVSWEMVPDLAIPRTDEAVLASEYLAGFFIKEAGKSKHRFLCPETKEASLIGNFTTVYTGDLGRLERAYIFD